MDKHPAVKLESWGGRIFSHKRNKAT